MIKFCQKCKSETERKKNLECKPCAVAYSEAYRLKNSAAVKAYNAAWAKANPEFNAAYRIAHPEYDAIYYASNSEKAKSNAAAWAKANPYAKRIHAQNRRTRKLENGGVLSKGLADKLFKMQKGKCACCNQPLGKDFNLDHIMPLALGGTNTNDNMQLLLQRCNNQKHAKHPIDFMQIRGFLL
jgi:5-methylcytosine-specific restriction endonuclease McrA